MNADLTHIHPARLIPFADLCAQLDTAVQAGLVRRVDHDGATLYCYTKDCVYNRAWTPITKIARGLIIDHEQRKIVATPFPKFFNVGEDIDSIPDLPFQIFEKLDGSLIIIYWHRDRWRAATKGSLNSPQAQWAQALLDKTDTLHLYPGCTYLSEGIYADNRIVIRYPYEGLVLLGAYNNEGREISHQNLRLIAGDIGWRVAKRYDYTSMSDLVARTKVLPVTEEGWVLLFANGLRLKLKGDAYCAVHRLISGCTPLALWDSMLNGADLRLMRKELPEEFWPDFDKITSMLAVRLATFLHQVDTAVASVAHLDDRELGKTLFARIQGPWADFVFYRRKKGTLLVQAEPGKPVPLIRRSAFMQVRPTGNRLEGYTPSASVHRVQEELA